MDQLEESFAGAAQVQQLKNVLSGSPRARVQLKGLVGSALSFYAAQVVHDKGGAHFFVLNDKEEAAYFFNDLQTLLGEKNVLFLPESYRQYYGARINSNIIIRNEALERLSKSLKRGWALVTFPEALAELVWSGKKMREKRIDLTVNMEADMEDLRTRLYGFGFEAVDFVYEPGQFSIRGGIIDIYTYHQEFPFRIEWIGDQIASLRTFEPDTQLSVSMLDHLSILPNLHDQEDEKVPVVSLPDQDAVLWVKDAMLVRDRVEEERVRCAKAYDALEDKSQQPPPDRLLVAPEDLLQGMLEYATVEFGRMPLFGDGETITFHTRPQPSFNKNFELLSADLAANNDKQYQNFIFADHPKQIERLYAILEDLGARVQGDLSFTPFAKSLHEGFVDDDLKLAVYTDHQIFNRYHKFRLRTGFTGGQALTLKELYDLKPGDYVTHIDHGVGRFDGLETIDVNGKKQEAVRLTYQDKDILYVSIHSLHRIMRFSGKDGVPPKVNKLGSKAWANLKQKTKKKVKDIAKDLIALYAKRKAKQGFAFTPDTYLQHELEASFLYEDTPDQEKATADVKKDMEQSTPMDRLICGDVGFGKTEIAIRAAFKAVADSKQVAILAPTTILTMQHAKTFRERLKDFPCTVDYINRFRSSAQQKETLKKLEEGKIDIIIGTHRLLSKDVKFKDLGLLIIDEEQKFGVSAKEKLKAMRAEVDTLTLTATPIPRTLHFSLMGARDLSVINTPPPNRYPIQTQLHPFNESVIGEAVDYELSRGGQVFFVHNRVKNIQEVALMVERTAPGARVAVAHGQMEGKQLEKIMVDFIDGKYDVLVATTIIESGLDIPNANTIIINQAHMYGLSDLHQMRGRVGRSNKKAFCYLLAPPLVGLSNDARRRLQAIEEFSDLSSGFNIALRDMDIRGAGNLLGAEQSGFISEMGFEAYHQVLDEAIRELKHEEFRELFKDEEQELFVKDCQIESDLEILIPDSYVNKISERLALYRELNQVTDEAGLEVFESQMKDRFGPLPAPVLDLMDTMRLKWVGAAVGLEKIFLKNERLFGHFPPPDMEVFYQSDQFSRLLAYIQQQGQNMALKQSEDRLRLVIRDVHSVDQALSLLREIETIVHHTSYSKSIQQQHTATGGSSGLIFPPDNGSL
ncbi:MAG: transcription-repair coupling factor [Flavobacteriales bacterium]|nr:transcription-repair coupling factor [Flavobacteriales bacterium]MCB9449173.1 transcription-repair coupling factor [Flavobacteriales bacterium]